jgi:hypothetical protein
LAYTALVDPSQLPGAGSTAVFGGAYRVATPGTRSRPTAAVTRVRFESASTITYYRSSSGAGTAVDFTVVGDLNNLPGHILTGQALDGGPAGSGLDTVSITIRTPTGARVYSSSGPGSEGDVVITP